MTEGPVMISCKPMSSEYEKFYTVAISSDKFTIGRSQDNSVVIPCIGISRNHCSFTKTKDNKWLFKNMSRLSIKINNERLEMDGTQILSDGDIIYLEPTREFIYKFVAFNEDIDEEIPTKRMKMDDGTLDEIKIKFEQSQNNEMKPIEEKINSIRKKHQKSVTLKERLKLNMNRKIQLLKTNYASKIKKIKGGKNVVKTKKALLCKERDAQLAQIKNEMERKIADTAEQITKYKETESELLNENKLLKKKLTKEREEFLSELSHESSSKQDVLDKLVAKIRKQEEVRLQEKQKLEEILKKAKEQLIKAKQNELKALQEKQRLRERELKQQLDNIKKSLTKEMEQSELKRLDVEKKLNSQLQEMKKLSDKEKIKSEQLQKDREIIQKQLMEAKQSSKKYIQEMQQHIMKRETELAALAADRISQQADLSSETIVTLQTQLESIKSQLQTVEEEKKTLLENICDNAGEGTSKQSALTEVSQLMENELQCSICAELFIEATTLNCSHTFCKYCITTWKKKKRDCPICRCTIIAENRSLVLDTFIEKMVQNLTEEMKIKRRDLLKYREELVSETASMTAITSGSSSGFFYDTDFSTDDDDDDDYDEEEDGPHRSFSHWTHYVDSDTYSGSDDSSDADQSWREAANSATAADGTTSAATGSVSYIPTAYCFRCELRGYRHRRCPHR